MKQKVIEKLSQINTIKPETTSMRKMYKYFSDILSYNTFLTLYNPNTPGRRNTLLAILARTEEILTESSLEYLSYPKTIQKLIILAKKEKKNFDKIYLEYLVENISEKTYYDLLQAEGAKIYAKIPQEKKKEIHTKLNTLTQAAHD